MLHAMTGDGSARPTNSLIPLLQQENHTLPLVSVTRWNTYASSLVGMEVVSVHGTFLSSVVSSCSGKHYWARHPSEFGDPITFSNRQRRIGVSNCIKLR